jgi:McbB family protein
MPSNYAVIPFGLSESSKGAYIQTIMGFFEIEDPATVSILKRIINERTVSDVELRYLLRDGDDDQYNSIIHALENDLNLLVSIPMPRSIELQNPSRRIRSLFRFSFPNIVEKIAAIVGTAPAASPLADVSLYVCERTPSRNELENAVSGISKEQILISIFPVRETVVITSPYRADARVPCPCCIFDYATERVFFNASETELSLYDVFSLVVEGGAMPPCLPVGDDDWLYVARHTKKYTDTLNGFGFSSISRPDPFLTSIIDLANLSSKRTKVPFSPICNCLRRVREITAQCKA